MSDPWTMPYEALNTIRENRDYLGWDPEDVERFRRDLADLYRQLDRYEKAAQCEHEKQAA